MRTILSFDVEEHDRIEAATGLTVSAHLKAHYRQRMDWSTRWILEVLEEQAIQATFFLVGEAARDNPALVKAIHAGGHEIASHSWDHRRVHRHSRASFREDVRTSKDALEQLIGEPVRGFRAPTFSVMHQTGWAVDILADLELAYDSSIYPVRHDRYGVPAAPRGPFRVHGRERSILEIPPATLRLGWTNLPVGGGGYFRLLPLSLMRWSLRQVERGPRPAVAMLYFHPWEFDPDQERLPLPLVNRVRTYVGVQRSQRRLQTFLRGRAFHRADRVVAQLLQEAPELPDYVLGPGEVAEASLLDHTPDWMLTQLNDDCSPC